MTENMYEILQNRDYYEIRLESIGGLGANLCGKMLGELAVRYLNLNSAAFSSYGSEKTGTPVKGYIRYCLPEKEIRIHSPVVHPDLLAVFHQALMHDQSVWKGCGRQTKVLVALDEGQEELSGGLPDDIKECYVVNARQIAMASKSRINVVMLGAIAKVMGVASLEDVRQICRDSLGKKYPDALEGNLKGLESGYEQVRNLTLCTETVSRKEKRSGESQEWGYATAPIGGVNPRFGSTAVADLSPSRQGYIPIFIKERCINCGLCDSTCPDMVFQFSRGEYNGKEMMVNQGLDYYHCKGCMRCVNVCPVNALVQGSEAEHVQKQYFIPNQDMLRVPDYYVESGPDGYITSESYLTEVRMEGGEV
ncbi:MAG: 2-oxoacid:acceptor oxidoreductase family protein [Lachnospiraceae bacterium]|nr:2-oxoacid:acceptor oxidoreductase family protein [Lachnospiraceae bacterium]